MNTFFQSKDGKLFPMTPVTLTPVTRCYTWPRDDITWLKTIPTGWRGTGRGFVADTGGKRRAGKPFAAARMRGDLIVALVRQLQQDKPRRKLDGDIIKQASNAFKVDPKTVWNALRLDRKLGPGTYAPIPIGWIGPIRWYGRTMYTQVVRAPGTSVTPAPMAPVKIPSPADFPNDPHAYLLQAPTGRSP